jgi:hypothetical protein
MQVAFSKRRRESAMMAHMATKFADMFVDPENASRVDPPTQVEERATLAAFIRWQHKRTEVAFADQFVTEAPGLDVPMV